MLVTHSEKSRPCGFEKPAATGFSLIEVAVALAVMSVGLSGLAALLLSAVSGTSLSSQRSAAAWLADGLAVQLDLVPGAVEAAAAADEVAACVPAAPCEPARFAHAAIGQWRDAVAQTLPGGAGRVCRDGSPLDGTADAPACDGAGGWVIKTFWRPRGAVADRVERHIRALP